MGIDDILVNANPLYDELFPYAKLLAVVALMFWLIAKINLIKNQKETIQGTLIKGIILLTFIFNWKSFFISTYYFAEFSESLIKQYSLKIYLPEEFEKNNVEKMYSSEELEKKDFDDLTDYFMNVKVYASKREAEALQRAEQKVQEESLGSTGNLSWYLTQKRKAKEKAKEILEEEGYTSSDDTVVTVGLKYISEAAIKDIMIFLAQILRQLVYILRIGFSYLFFIITPFLVVFSNFPILGNNKGQEALNEYSRSMINWSVNIAFWPAIYALLDHILVSMYYTILETGSFNDIITFTAYFCFVLVSYITIPISIQKANPYGVLHGMVSTISMVGTMAASTASTAVSAAAGGVSGSGVGGSIASVAKQGYSAVKNSVNSNLSAATREASNE